MLQPVSATKKTQPSLSLAIKCPVVSDAPPPKNQYLRVD
jgi:hypothetical protein